MLSNTSVISREMNDTLQVIKSEYFQQTNATSEITEHCQNIDLNLAYTSIPIFLLSLFIGSIIRSYFKSLDVHEKNIVVFLDNVISIYLQEQ